MVLKDIQHLETAVGVNANIFYVSMIMGAGGIICNSLVTTLPFLSEGLVFFSVLLLIWCDTHFDSELVLSSTMHVRRRADQLH
jgi:hypothetical protein